MIPVLLLGLLGLAVGAYGTLIGVGGGFLLVPILLWIYPADSSITIASISLAVVFFNAFSGTVAYAKQRRIDFKSGLIFAAAALPGTVAGALSTAWIPRRWFDLVIGCLLVLAAGFLIARPLRTKNTSGAVAVKKGHFHVRVTDNSGTTHEFSYRLWLGILLSTVIGFISSILGIGGGIIHVPALVHLLNFPVHLATATSHFILTLMAFTGSVTHYIAGALEGTFVRIAALAVGAVIGAQIGAHFSSKVSSTSIIRALAVALLLVGLRTVWGFWR